MRLTNYLLQQFVVQYDPLLNLKTIQAIGPTLFEEWKRNPKSWEKVFRFHFVLLFIKATNKELTFINRLWGALFDRLKQKKTELLENNKIIDASDMTDYRPDILRTFIKQCDSIINFTTHDFIATRMEANWRFETDLWKNIFRRQLKSLNIDTNEANVDFINELWGSLLTYLSIKERKLENNDN